MDQQAKKSRFGFLRDSVNEIRKITWPTASQAFNMTVLVIIVTIVTTAIIAGLDFGFTAGYQKLVQTSKDLKAGAAAEDSATVTTPDTTTTESPIKLPTE